jgi:hypothetical protein
MASVKDLPNEAARQKVEFLAAISDTLDMVRASERDPNVMLETLRNLPAAEFTRLFAASGTVAERWMPLFDVALAMYPDHEALKRESEARRAEIAARSRDDVSA